MVGSPSGTSSARSLADERLNDTAMAMNTAMCRRLLVKRKDEFIDAVPLTCRKSVIGLENLES